MIGFRRIRLSALATASRPPCSAVRPLSGRYAYGVGPRLDVHGLGLVANHAYSAPYEDLRLKKR